MHLLRSDTVTEGWRRFEQDCITRLDELRILNDAPQTEAKTAELRGKIAEVKRILALSQESAKQGVSPNRVFNDLEEHSKSLGYSKLF